MAELVCRVGDWELSVNYNPVVVGSNPTIIICPQTAQNKDSMKRVRNPF